MTCSFDLADRATVTFAAFRPLFGAVFRLAQAADEGLEKSTRSREA